MTDASDASQHPLDPALRALQDATDAVARGLEEAKNAFDRGLRGAAEAVHRAALHDHKTPLLNERALALAGNELNADLQRLWKVFAGDIDDFKNLNSSFRYEEVDLVLDAVGGCLLALAQDVGGNAFRRGGDEFVLVVPEDLAAAAATRLSSAFSSFPVRLPSAEEPVPVRVSFGCATITRDLPFGNALGRAERACKAAKWIADRVVVDASENLPCGWSARPRCLRCRTQLTINAAPNVPRPESLTCPCGEVMLLGEREIP
jgi:diguanylate cyclase (GGDEF)-like protein